MDHWQIDVSEGDDGNDVVVVYRNGSWYSDADDLDDAIGILNGQRASEAVINEHGYVTRRTL